jgi:hypothetical protein
MTYLIANAKAILEILLFVTRILAITCNYLSHATIISCLYNYNSHVDNVWLSL